MKKVLGHSSLRDFIASGEERALTRKISIARAMAVQLARVHACHILHGSVSLDSFLINPADQSLFIIDFLGAVQLAPDAYLEGLQRHALPEPLILTPEGSRHSDLPIDHRTDLYALGCALYELFAGRPVFSTNDRTALLHAHLAKLPEPLSGIDNIPRILSDIVTALINKQADERYQRAVNLVIDLDIVRGDFETAGRSGRFPLRLRTRGAALAGGDFLYGRDQQRSRLAEALAAARNGRPQGILIAGLPGVGKSALSRQFARELEQTGGRAALGKFEQLQTNAPYLGIIRCFDALIDHILNDTESTIDDIAHKLRWNLSENLPVLTNILPRIHNITGGPLSREPLSGFGARDRLAQCFLGFLESVASPERPVVLVFDDLQWADSASVDLLQRLAAGLASNVLLVGLIRTERNGSSQLPRASEALTVNGAPPFRLDLMALTRSDVEDLLVGFFGTRQNQIDAAALVYAKTLGSPLFISQFLNKIGDDVVLDPASTWNIDKIANLDGAADIGEFLSTRIRSLDQLSRQVLATGACFGMSFDPEVLNGFLQIEDAVLTDRLAKLVSDGFCVSAASSYRFAHDRVREAAYELADNRAIIHRTIGQHLLAEHDKGGIRFDAYTIATHLKAAGDLSDEPILEERYLQVVHLAAHRAHDAAAFDIARSYADTALGAAKPDRWATDYATMAATLLVKASSTVAQQDHTRFDLEYGADLDCLQTNEHRLKLSLVRVMSLNARALCEEAIVVGLNALRLVGIDLPENRADQHEAVGREITAFWEAMAGRSPAELIHVAPLEDDCIAIAMQLLFRLAPNAHATTQLELFALMAVRNANLLLRHGRDAQASGIIMTLALVLARATGDLDLADQFGRVALDLDVREGRRPPAGVSFVYTYFFSHWIHPLEASLPSNLDGMRAGYALGDLQFGSFHAAAYVIHLTSLGAPLRDVVRAGRDHDQLIAGRVKVASFHCQLETAFAQALQGMTAAVTSLSMDTAHDPDEVLRTAAALAQADRGFFLARHLQLAYIFCDFKVAARYADAAFQALPGIAGNFVEAEVVMFGLLADLAAGSGQMARFQTEVVRLQQWAKLNPTNFGCRLSLVLAEHARVDARPSEAIAHYGQAIREAKRHRFMHMAALAAERAARFFLAMADDIAGTAYIREAVTLYGEWGAQAKVAALREEFREGGPTIPVMSGDGRQSELESVLLSAARAISAEIDLERLLQQIMTSVQEISGATYGALILRQEAAYFVEVVARHGERVRVCDALAHPLDDSQLVPRTIIASVRAERATLVLRNAGSSAFARDPYVKQNAVVSILCAPLVGAGKLDGFIYLENNITAGSFGPQLEKAVQVLASQAAIALANARLFALLDRTRNDLASANEDLERKIGTRTEELAKAHAVAVDKAAEADRARLAEREANDAKSRFLSVVSHEIRTPMNGVLGMLQLLDRERLDAKARRQVEIAQESGLALLKLIDGVLDYSRLELGTSAATHEHFQLRSLVDSSVEIFRPSLEAKGINLSVDIVAPAAVVLNSDARGIGRVLMNLVGNSAKFTSEGAVTVAVTLLSGQEPGAATLSLSVRDTGIGIPKEMQDSIFEEFVQADSSIVRRHAGTGLGLAICSRIIALLGGTITVSSTPGSGSLFVATCPVAIGVEPGSATVTAQTVMSLSLLVVDDDAINREVTYGLLEQLGHSVVCAESGTAAVAAVACHSFDAMILDLHMPDLDGLETVDRIRSSVGTRPLPPVIILTADLTEASRRRCLNHGIARILPKPLRKDALLDMLAGLSGDKSQIASFPVHGTSVNGSLFAERCELLGISRVARLLRKYRRGTREAIEAIRLAALRTDHLTVARLAHRIRSASGSLHLAEMEELAHRLEIAASSDEDSVNARALALPSALRRSVAAAMRELRTLQRSGFNQQPTPGNAECYPRRSISGPSL